MIKTLDLNRIKNAAISDKKSELQRQALELTAKDQYVVYNFAVNSGKSLAALQKTLPTDKVLYIAPRISVIESFKKEVLSYNNNLDIKYSTTKGLHKFKNKIFDIIIFDECHNITDLVIKNIRKIQYNRFLGLSGTINFDKYMLLKDLHNFIFVKFTLKDSFLVGLNKLPSISVAYLNLDDKERIYYFDYNKNTKIKKIETTYDYIVSKKYPYENLRVLCTQKEYYELLCHFIYYYDGLIENGDYTLKGIYKKLQFNFRLRRKQFLAECKLKTVDKVLTDKLADKKCIIFNNRIKNISKSSKSKHSKTNDNDFLDFVSNKNNVKHLHVVDQVNEGINIKDLDWIVIYQTHNNYLIEIQRLGRVLRGEDPKALLFVFKDTIDENNLKKFKDEIGEENFKYYSFNLVI